MAKVKIVIERYPHLAPDLAVMALDEDGKYITAHVSSSLSWAKKDIQRENHIKAIEERYPDGYELDWTF